MAEKCRKVGLEINIDKIKMALSNQRKKVKLL